MSERPAFLRDSDITVSGIPGGFSPARGVSRGRRNDLSGGRKGTGYQMFLCKVRVIGELFALDEARGWRMNDFKGRHFEGEIVLITNPWRARNTWIRRYP